MAQGSYVLADQSRTSFRQNLNVALAAAATNNSGAAQPSPTYPHMWWPDEGTNQLWQRNAGNTAWILRGSLSLPNWGLAPLAGATFTGPVALPNGSTVDGYLPVSSSGTRNLLINANPIINQRGYVSATATTAANQYTLDRWRVVTSGQSISWSDSGGVRTVTAPAGGVEQVIEGASLLSGAYSLNWTGTASATVAGASVAKGGTVTLTGGVDTTVRFSGGTFSLPQLEPGSVATTFERRLLPQGLLLCQRYFQTGESYGFGYAANVSNKRVAAVFLKGQMRAAPTVTFTGSSGSNANGSNAENISSNMFGVFTYVPSVGEYSLSASWIASAEL